MFIFRKKRVLHPTHSNIVFPLVTLQMHFDHGIQGGDYEQLSFNQLTQHIL